MGKELIIHPGIFETPAIYKRLRTYAKERGYQVSFHRCLNDIDGKFADNTVHLAHSGGYTCLSLRSYQLIWLVAPATNQAFWPAFFQKFLADIASSIKHWEWGMFFYKHTRVLNQILFHSRYWQKMNARYRTFPSRHLVPKHAHIILYENDSWSEGYDWSKFDVTRLPGHHDELIYRPETTLNAVYDNDKLKN